MATRDLLDEAIRLGSAIRRLAQQRATWHYAINDYDGPRVYRKVIAG